MDQRSRSIAQGVALGLQRKSETQQQLSMTETQQLKRSIHDLEAFKQKKTEESSPFFRTARVQTCSHVMMRNGKAIAVAFPLDKTGWKNPNAYGNVKRSSETESWSK